MAGSLRRSRDKWKRLGIGFAAQTTPKEHHWGHLLDLEIKAFVGPAGRQAVDEHFAKQADAEKQEDYPTDADAPGRQRKVGWNTATKIWADEHQDTAKADANAD